MMAWWWCHCHLLCNKKKKKEEEEEEEDNDIVIFFFEARRRDRRRLWWHHGHFLCSKKMQKIRKEEEKGTYLQPPTSATTLKLFLLWRSCCHHVEAPFVGALLKLLWISRFWSFELLKFSVGWKLWQWKWAQKEVGGEGISRMREVGGLVGRSAVGGLG